MTLQERLKEHEDKIINDLHECNSNEDKNPTYFDNETAKLIAQDMQKIIGDEELLHLEEWTLDEGGVPKSNTNWEQKYKNMFRKARNELRQKQRQALEQYIKDNAKIKE